MAKASDQKNYRVTPEFKERFDRWVEVHGYDHAMVYMAAIMAFSEMSIEERMEAFAAVSEWIDAGFPSLLRTDAGKGPIKLTEAFKTTMGRAAKSETVRRSKKRGPKTGK